MPPKPLRPFTSRSQEEEWQARNCRDCQKFTYGRAQTCDISNALTVTSFAARTIPDELLQRMGYFSHTRAYTWDCPERVSFSVPHPTHAPDTDVKRKNFLRFLGVLVLLGGLIWAWQYPWFERLLGLGVLSVMMGGIFGQILWQIGRWGREICLRWGQHTLAPDAFEPPSFVPAPLPWFLASMLGCSIFAHVYTLDVRASFCQTVEGYVAIESKHLTGSVLDGSFRIPKEDTPEGARYRLLGQLENAASKSCR